MSKRKIGGILHTYQKYDPVHFPSPTAPPPDVVSPILEQMLRFGSYKKLTPEELAQLPFESIPAKSRAWGRASR
jgi:hypothetical protein